MPYQISTFAGDVDHPIFCRGDAVVGDRIAFERATFSGSLTRPKFAGFELITGTIVADSYGSDKQQHTFTLERQNGSKTLIKGRNLYANGLYRAVWIDESQRRQAAAEKHARGNNARAARDRRIEERDHAGF